MTGRQHDKQHRSSRHQHTETSHLPAAVALNYRDQPNDGLERLDAEARFTLLRNVTLFAETQNPTDAPTRQYQGNRKDRIIQKERYGRTFYSGVSVKV